MEFRMLDTPSFDAPPLLLLRPPNSIAAPNMTSAKSIGPASGIGRL